MEQELRMAAVILQKKLRTVIRLVVEMFKLLREKEGSITLEATIVFPVFLALLLLLINFINICMMYTAMDHAVSETVKQIATHAYPLKYLGLKPVTDSADLLERIIKDPTTLNNDLPKEFQSAIISDITTVFGNEIKKSAGKALNPALEKVARYKIKKLYSLGKLEDEDFEINNLSLSNEDVAMTVEYKAKLLVPFFPLRELALSNTAVERAWVNH